LNFERFTDRRLFTTPGTVKLGESPGKAGGLPFHSKPRTISWLFWEVCRQGWEYFIGTSLKYSLETGKRMRYPEVQDSRKA
jgi:hypothetical protein